MNSILDSISYIIDLKFSDEFDVLDFSLSVSNVNLISPVCANAAQLGTKFFPGCEQCCCVGPSDQSMVAYIQFLFLKFQTKKKSGHTIVHVDGLATCN